MAKKVVFAGKQKSQSKGTAQLLERGGDRVGWRFSVFHFLGDEMCDRFGIGIADEFPAAPGQLLAQFAKIFDDAIVNNRHGFSRMRVGIIFGRPAVRRPARVTDADRPAQRLALQTRFKRAQFAFGAPPPEDTLVERRDPRGIIAAVFEPLEGINQLPGNRLGSQNSDYSAHPLG